MGLRLQAKRLKQIRRSVLGYDLGYLYRARIRHRACELQIRLHRSGCSLVFVDDVCRAKTIRTGCELLFRDSR